MPTFDQSTAYRAKEDVYFDDGREVTLLRHIYSNPDLDTKLRNNPAGILAAIDEYARSNCFLMNVGSAKGQIVTDTIASRKPAVMVELGGYVGYSALLFGNALRQASGPKAKYYSVERDPVFAAIVASLIDLAGLRDTVRVVVGSGEDGIRRLHADGMFDVVANGTSSGGETARIDMMFLDHYKPAYVTDLKACEQLGLIRPGTVLAADNVVAPGNPPYLEYVRATVEQKREMAAKSKAGNTNGNGIGAQFPERTAAQYAKRYGDVAVDETVVGRPGIVYESKLVESFEPTGEPDGVEITKCIEVRDD